MVLVTKEYTIDNRELLDAELRAFRDMENYLTGFLACQVRQIVVAWGFIKDWVGNEPDAIDFQHCGRRGDMSYRDTTLETLGDCHGVLVFIIVTKYRLKAKSGF
jgi:hypothetical protein